MKKYTRRQADYRALSRWVQRVILGAAPPGRGVGAVPPELPSTIVRTVAVQAADQTRDLEFSSAGPREATALRELRSCLYDLAESSFAETPRSHAAVVAAADRLASECPDFVSPPLNAIWAAAAPVNRG